MVGIRIKKTLLKYQAVSRKTQNVLLQVLTFDQLVTKCQRQFPKNYYFDKYLELKKGCCASVIKSLQWNLTFQNLQTMVFPSNVSSIAMAGISKVPFCHTLMKSFCFSPRLLGERRFYLIIINLIHTNFITLSQLSFCPSIVSQMQKVISYLKFITLDA